MKTQAAFPFFLYDARGIDECVEFLCFCLLHAECPNTGQCYSAGKRDGDSQDLAFIFPGLLSRMQKVPP